MKVEMNHFQKTHTVKMCWIHTIQSHGHKASEMKADLKV